MKYLIILFTFFLLSACSTRPLSEQIVERVIENVTDTDISYNGAGCNEIKRSCPGNSYEEWYQQNGKLACACNK